MFGLEFDNKKANSFSLFLITILLFSFSLSAWAEDSLRLRKKYTLLNWPSIQTSNLSFSLYEQKFSLLEPERRKTLVLDYCSKYVDYYSKFIEKDLSTSNLSPYFSSACDDIEPLFGYFFNQKKNFHDVSDYLVQNLDNKRISLEQLPKLRSLLLADRSIASYNKSLFGLMGIPFEFQYTFYQLSILALFLVVTTGIVLSSRKYF